MVNHQRKSDSSLVAECQVEIESSNIIRVLVEHFDGKRDMSITQVAAGIGLLKKVIPDLSRIDPCDFLEMTDEQLENTLAYVRKIIAGRAGNTNKRMN